MDHPLLIPLPDKRVCDLTPKQLRVFRRWIGYEDGGEVVSYPTAAEKLVRRRRERWKARHAGKGATEPRLLVRAAQIENVRHNAQHHRVAQRWLDDIFQRADAVADGGPMFWSQYIEALGPWNCRGSYCPNCIGKKSAEGLNRYFWHWDWRDPERIRCPFCDIVYPDARYKEEGVLMLPRLGLEYTFYLRPEERDSADWRLGEHAARYVNQLTHMSFSGHIRAMKLEWALEQASVLSLAYALGGDKRYAREVEEILSRLAQVYPGYPLCSYVHDIVDADPGYATENADALPTLFKRNACIAAYDGRYGGFAHAETTTQTTKVASGLWGCSRIAPELSATAQTFLSLFQAYDLVKAAIAPENRRHIEQDFLLEFFLDVRAYTSITNKSGPVRAARVAFGLVYDDERELKAGIDGFHQILQSHFYGDGSMKESPLYGHKPIGEDLWRIPEMLRGRRDLYGDGLYKRALQTFAELATPLGTQPVLDDTYDTTRVPKRTVDIARIRCDVRIPDPGGPASDFALLNSDLSIKKGRTARRALNKYYEGRHLAFLGLGRGAQRIQLYALGEENEHHGHRHADPLNVQLYAGAWEIFPDVGYIWDHPGKKWAGATASHQTVVVDEKNSAVVAPIQLLGYCATGRARFVDMAVELENGVQLRRALKLLPLDDGLPLLIDLFEVEGGSVHDYKMRAQVPNGPILVAQDAQRPPRLFEAQGSMQQYLKPERPPHPPRVQASGVELKTRRRELYQDLSYYPLRDFRSGGRVDGNFTALWKGRDRQVRAHVLTPCSELVAYRSPAWRSALAIADGPDNFHDTAVLRSRKKRSRFLVVYEMTQGRRQLHHVTAENTASASTVMLKFVDGRRIEIAIPPRMQADSQEHWDVRWRKK
jgi:hypothetical protein